MSIVVNMTRPTIMDVARKCGVSKTTVSVILNDSPASSRVPKETQDRVRAMAEGLGYRPNWRARALASRKTHTIGVLYYPPMPLVVRGNYEGIMAGINEVLSARGYHMLYVPLGDKTEEWQRILLDQRMDGCLVLSRLRQPLADILKRGGLRATLVNADSDEPLPTVIADDFHGSEQCTQHLISLGHKRITFFAGKQPPHYSLTQREEGYAAAMKAAGLEKQICIVSEGDADQFVHEFVATNAQRCTAVLVYTHYLAIKLLQKSWEAGISVPHDLSVVTFSNAYPVEDVIPPLTTVALPTEEMGRTAAELVLEQIESNGAAKPRRIVLKETLIVRKSTAAPSEERR
ncbi:LacI family DNA-binding transcriptional regulator [soil metagenome]